jgi:hypothetical protein
MRTGSRVNVNETEHGYQLSAEVTGYLPYTSESLLKLCLLLGFESRNQFEFDSMDNIFDALENERKAEEHIRLAEDMLKFKIGNVYAKWNINVYLFQLKKDDEWDEDPEYLIDEIFITNNSFDGGIEDIGYNVIIKGAE